MELVVKRHEGAAVAAAGVAALRYASRMCTAADP